MTVQWFRSLKHLYAKHYPATWLAVLMFYGRVIATGRCLAAALRSMLAPSQQSQRSLASSKLLLRYVRHAND
jgi:hypothetical protein